MDIQKYKNQLQETVVIPMTEFMGEDEDCGFTKKDIEKCESLILKYLLALEQITTPTNKEIMKHVKSLVLALNKLNEKTDYAMLETDERESICVLVQDFAVACGLAEIPEDDDVTGEWREF